MSWLVAHYLPWIGVSLLLGLAVGWVCAERPAAGASQSHVLLALAGVALASWIAFMNVLPGRAGHGFEVLLLGVGYVFGGLIGEPLRLAFAPPLAPRASAADEGAGAIAVHTPDGGLAAVAAAAIAATRAPAEQSHAAPGRAASRPADLALTSIAGIGPNVAGRLAEIGVTKVADLSRWSAEDAAYVGERIGEPGRVEREMWIAQARLLASGVETSHSIALRMGRVKAAEADAPIAYARLASLRLELEDLSESAGVNAFSFAAPRTADAMRVEPGGHDHVSDDHKPALLAARPAEGVDDLKLIWGVRAQA